MKLYTFAILLFFITYQPLNAQRLPDGYILQYEQNFNSNEALCDFRFSNPQSWGIFKNKDNFFLQFDNDSAYNPSVTSPKVIALLNNHIFGDFILEVNIMPLWTTRKLLSCVFF
jgi:hypothetical protein